MVQVTSLSAKASATSTTSPLSIILLIINLAVIIDVSCSSSASSTNTNPPHWAPNQVFTNSFLVQLRNVENRDHADVIALRNGFENWGPVIGSNNDYHFVQRALPHARTKRSVLHTRQLKADPMIHKAVQQMGFRRFKRGYKADRLAQIVQPDGNGPNRPSGMRDPTDPFPLSVVFEKYRSKWR